MVRLSRRRADVAVVTMGFGLVGIGVDGVHQATEVPLLGTVAHRNTALPAVLYRKKLPHTQSHTGGGSKNQRRRGRERYFRKLQDQCVIV